MQVFWGRQAVFLCYNEVMRWLQDKKQAIVVGALIYDDSEDLCRVFLAKRANGRKFLPGVYEIPSGRVSYGEKLERGLERQIKEKLHVDIEVEEPIAVFDYLDRDNNVHAVQVIYLARLRGAEPKEITLRKNKHSESIWISQPAMERVLGEMKESFPEEYAAVARGLGIVEEKKKRRTKKD